MSLPLDLGDQLVDRQKSSLFLYYLARATNKVNQRDVMRRKVELSIKQLKKISTKHLHEHIDELNAHVQEALSRERAIQTQQQSEEVVHKDLHHKISRLETKLGKYLETQEGRKKRIAELEDKIKEKFTHKTDKLKNLKSDLARLMVIYTQAKGHADKKRVNELAKRIEAIKFHVARLA